MVWFGVLGPLVAEDERGPLALKGPRHRAVLARLLIARGRVVPVDVLVGDLWPDPPDGAVGALQTFVAALRRALEPARPPRTPATVLVTSGPGYALRAESVDAWAFEAAVTAPGATLSQVDEALGRWRGPAYAEFAEEPWARGEINRLEELRLLAVERRASALLELGRAAEAVPDLEAHVQTWPLREEGWRLLALALYRAGRQGDALGALRRARRLLATELGVDPGPGLRQAEADVLAQVPIALPVLAPHLVGRADELALLSAEASTARAGRLRLALISGEAGAGKTALAEAFAAQLATQGWRTAWGASPDDEGLPPVWPWTRILEGLAGRPTTSDPPPSGGSTAGTGPTPADPAVRGGSTAPQLASGGESTPTQPVSSSRAPSLDPEPGADPVAARFRRHQAVAAHLTTLGRAAPLLLVFDDLQWAGAETLTLLASVVADPSVRHVLVVGTHRSTDLPATLAEFLGRVARAEPARVYLGGLPADDVRDLVRATLGRDVPGPAAAAIHRRSGGNPFFVRELARLFDTDASADVPPGVRDVVRHRTSRLPATAQEVLRRASVLGRDVDLGLLASVADADVLDDVEAAVRAGFLVEPGPGRVRFAHDLVRDTLYHDLSRTRRARWHADAGEALERLRPDDVDALAHHFLLAESPSAVRYARQAAERAERRVAPHEAARLWRAALNRAGDDVRERLDLIMGLVRALAVTGDLAQAREHRAEAVTLAETLGDPLLTASVLGAFDVPAIWTANDDPELAARIVTVAEKTLVALPPERRAERARLLATLALELRNTGGDRGREAAREAEALARELGDPALLAFALNARFMQAFDRAGLAPERARIGRELVDVAASHGLVTFEVLGHLVLVQAYSALADLPAADTHAAAADRLAEVHDLPLVGVFTQWYGALRASITGDPAAEARFRAAAARLPGTGMTGLEDGLLDFALLCHRGESTVDYHLGEAPHDLLYEARLCLQALSAIAAGDVPTMQTLYDALLPAEAELAGAGSGLLTLRPVAFYLGELATALGLPATAHYRKALELARRCNAPHWIKSLT
ncbi:BTAD domain-containing putative transcriptional regulator [Amycolatopsis sp., V23-08]|uniref:BTAD domain-containing putative transcriptional regulator n=1 Tax=Amycolatopsis heterodermiae TaxID=3110235 RepID=A0ABU5QVH5_9PSEU|nr:BTAD domain-containing putative transcriptional regulator [Amycolatopsis sp., V23-08]MEA5357911.1 BTAD domain-containing putative transcriptional regulator [Amycolatopsis sp., V23-08]